MNRYLAYALGEILLVMIGILLALQINNWNESRKERIEEQKVLKSLQADFQDNQQQLERIIELYRDESWTIRRFLEHFQPEPEFLPADSMKNFINSLLYIPKYNPNHGAVNSAISSGKISLIRHEELNKLLNTWPAKIDHNDYNATNLQKSVQDHLTPLLAGYYPIRNNLANVVLGQPNPSKLRYDQSQILSSLKLESLVEIRRLNSEVVLQRSMELRDFQARILELIERELKENGF